MDPLICRQQTANSTLRIESRERLFPSLRTTVADDFGFESTLPCILLKSSMTKSLSLLVTDNRLLKFLTLLQDTIVKDDFPGRFSTKWRTDFSKSATGDRRKYES